MNQWIELKNIATMVECTDWEEAITKAGELLLNSGYIKRGYINEMVQAVKELGPYIVMVPHVALAHARPSSSVLKEGLSVITLKKAVEFGSKHNDPVKLVIAFCAIDTNIHLESLRFLAKILEDDTKVEKIMNSNTPQEIYNILNK